MTSVLDELNAIKAKIASVERQIQSQDTLAADVATVRAAAVDCAERAVELRTMGLFGYSASEAEHSAREQERWAALFRTVVLLAENHIEARR